MPTQQRKKKPATKGREGGQSAQAGPIDSLNPRNRALATQRNERKSPLLMLLALPILLIIVTCSLVTWTYRRALDPLYGSIPTDLHLTKVVWAATLLAGFLPIRSGWLSAGLLGISICATPGLTYWIAVYTGSRLNDPVLGPVIVHLVVLLPLVYLSVSTVRHMVAVFESQQEGTMIRYTILPACATSITGFVPIWNDLVPLALEGPFLSYFSWSDAHLLFTIGGLLLSIWAISFPFLTGSDGDGSGVDTRFRLTWRVFVPAVVIPILPTVLPMLKPPVLQHLSVAPFVQPNSPVHILSSVQSITGLIVVGESLPPPGHIPHDYPSELRYLRASHSLLGGFWVGNKIPYTSSDHRLQRDSFGNPLGDSIYNAFLVQEAVRLVDKTDRSIGSVGETALVIGLGVGVAASALVHHNVTTTIIEIDPAVYNASVTYFGLPEPPSERLFLKDARRVVYEMHVNRTKGSTTGLYDYVIHDCFSAGGVPSHLYTVEFWSDLKAIMNPDGVVAVNFAGIVGADSSRSIMLTLQNSFEQCRIFHDSLEPVSNEALLDEFRNLIFFCSPSTKPLEFREAVENDYLGSPLRTRVLGGFGSQREVDPKVVLGTFNVGESEKWVLRDRSNQLAEWIKPAALSHWKVMRQVLPEVFWITY